MIPSGTIDALRSQLPNTQRSKPDAYYLIRGAELNELRALAMHLGNYSMDANTKRDWENRLNLMCHSAEETP